MRIHIVMLASGFALSQFPAHGESVDVIFRVRVPADTPPGATVYVAGNLEKLGRWRPDGFALKADGERHYTGTLSLPRGEVLEYKCTLGSWQRVEKAKTRADIGNRRLEVREGVVADVDVETWAQGTGARPKSSLTGTIRLHERFASRHLGNARTIAVYLPPRYESDRAARYPVLYLHDGQNVFDAATSAFGVEWGADETAERLIAAGAIRPVIIVAIANTERRADEYTADRDPKYGRGGRGDAYARFIVEELKPFIDAQYRTCPGREDTAVAGSSLGALISLQIAASQSDTFAMCGLISPAFGWAEEKALKDFEGNDISWTKHTRFWVDMGTREGARVDGPGTELPRSRRFVARLKSAGLTDGRDYRYVEVEGGEHNEAAWAARFGDVLRFFFPSNATAASQP
jgi:predicted alpha/beta superfamily hydrolase